MSTKTPISQLALVFVIWEFGQSWILPKQLPLAGLKKAQEHLLFVGRYFLSDYKTKII